MIDALLDNPELVATATTLLLGLLDAFRRYRQDETIRLRELPLIEFRALFEAVRKRLFAIDKPDHPSFETNLSIDDLQELLGEQGVKPRHPFSFVYRGEDYNGVLYHYDPTRMNPHRQIHIRAFELENGTEVMPHEEPHWYHHPIAHLRSKDMERKNAVEWTQMRLENQVPIGYPSD